MKKHDVNFLLDHHLPVKKYVWVSDLHLDAADEYKHHDFIRQVKQEDADALLIGGDISNGVNSLVHLRHLASLMKKPIYYVLGNHDYYYGSIEETRRKAYEILEELPQLLFLTAMNPVALTEDTALLGDDGWSDAQAGDFLHSDIELNDYYFIHELKNLQPKERKQKLMELGKKSADTIYKKLLLAFESFPQAVLLIHTPPFLEACLYKGKIADKNWAPHFVCQAVGDMLLKVMKRLPEKKLLVLCGHSHNMADVTILPNLRILAGHSDIGTPTVQGIIHVS
ncbi:MAG: metallophosphoesterase [Chlamydiales bacterium]|nr:metallophosphoesterase [Chlamydiia bacterium]MCP5508652.1 metallophosphoesterase [Chlamydiales bacterium]